MIIPNILYDARFLSDADTGSRIGGRCAQLMVISFKNSFEKYVATF